MQDSTYYEYLADEVTIQRNGAMDELARARTEVRLANIQVASLETQLFHAKQDVATLVDKLDAITEHALSLGGYCEHLEQNADAALAASQQRLRERIDILEAENARLESLVDWNFVDSMERNGLSPFRDEVFLVEEAPYQSNAPQDAEAPQAPPSTLIPTLITDLTDIPQDVLDAIAGKGDQAPIITVPPVGGIGAPGQGVAINNGEPLGNTEHVDDIQEIVLLPGATSVLDTLIQNNIDEHKPVEVKDEEPTT